MISEIRLTFFLAFFVPTFYFREYEGGAFSRNTRRLPYNFFLIRIILFFQDRPPSSRNRRTTFRRQHDRCFGSHLFLP